MAANTMVAGMEFKDWLNHPKGKILAGLYFLAVTGLIFSLFQDWAYDDPFITFRYADNLRRSLGFVYNPGERVLSTTTPLFTLLLAGLGTFWEDIPRIANLVGAASLAAGALALYDLTRTWRAPWAGWLALGTYPTFSLLVSTLGSETPLTLALCLWALAWYARGKYLWTAGLLALAVLARADAAVVVFVVIVDYLLRRRGPLPWKAGILFAGLTLPWVVFSSAYFGSPFPATLAAKQAQGRLLISEGFAPGLLTVAGWYAGSPWFRIEFLLAGMGLLTLVSRRHMWAMFLAWPVLYFGAYTFLGVTRYFWYYAPLVPSWLILAGLGIQGVWAAGTALIKAFTPAWEERIQKLVPGVLALALILGLTAIQASSLWRLRANPDPRYPVYRQVGEWLRLNTDQEALVGALEVGIIGYYAGNTMVDFAGLIQPGVAARFGPGTTYEEVAAWAIARFKPSYLVVFEGQLSGLEKEYAQKNCLPTGPTFGTAPEPGINLVIYDCL